jgi:hypothetical protein
VCFAAGRCWPANRHDVVMARATVAHLLDGRFDLGDGGYRGIRARFNHTPQTNAGL